MLKPKDPILRELIVKINRVVNQLTKDDNAAVVLRTYDGIFLYVNDVWTNRYQVDPSGKTIPELGILSEEEGQRSIVEDEQVKRDGELVTVDTYHINDVPVRMAVVRTMITYHGVRFMVGVIYNTAANAFGIDDDVQLSQGMLLSFRLQFLDDSRNF